MFEEIIDMLIDEKNGHKEYMKLAQESENEEVKKMFEFIANQEHDHYCMLKEYIEKYMIKQ